MVAPNAGPVPRSGSGLPVALVVLPWIFVGWPLSWILLFLSPLVGILFGVAITVGMIVAVATSGRRTAYPVIAWPSSGGLPNRVRRDVEGLASITAIGGCGWCGSLAAHRNDGGYQVHPRHWHAAEIEERVRSRLLRG